MKTREQRQPVLLKARLRLDGGWADGTVLNLSRRGMMIQSASPPPGGSYLEIRRGVHVIVARVVWTRAHRFGVRAQDVIDIDGLIREPDRSAPPGPRAEPIERRSANRPPPERHERSRQRGRIMEFACIAIVGGSAAIGAAAAVAEILSSPFEHVHAALAGATSAP